MNRLLNDHAPVHANGVALDRPDIPSPTQPRPRRLAFYEWLIRNLFPGVTTPVRIVLWNDDEIVTAAGEPIATVRIRDRGTLLQLVLNLDMAFGDAYSEGRVEIEGDLVALLTAAFRTPPTPPVLKLVRRSMAALLAPPRANSVERARDNIWHHYDLGNKFYELWLDEQLVYTCAYFPTETATLEEAQIAKMDHICRKLWLRPGETVVEAGCGWGALARHMAKHYGVYVKAYNLSREQIAYARQRAKAEGLEDQIQYVEADYRTIGGQYDVFVSVGMLEHVGLPNYRAFGDLIHRCLKPTGRGLIHSIGRNRPCPTNPWLEKRIFPGAYMPSLAEMMRVFEPWQFSVLDAENLRLHYAKTVKHWLSRFENASDQIREMFDEHFVRAWRLYLATSRAGFLAGHIQLFQIVFAPGQSNDIPWTRTHIYETKAEADLGRRTTVNGVHSNGAL